MAENLVEIRNLVKEFPIKGGLLHRQVGLVKAVADVDMDIVRGETIGLVGESGCGKTTLGRMLVRLLEPTSGTIKFDGDDITHVHGKNLLPFRRRVQIIFQDPYGSLDPRAQVGESISEGLAPPRRRRQRRAPRTSRRDARTGRSQRGSRRPLSPRVLRRPKTTHRHRPSAHLEARSSDCR